MRAGSVRDFFSPTGPVGAYWDRNVQIDVVGVRDDHRIDIGECKWGSIPSPGTLVHEIEGKLASHPNPRGATLTGRLFVRETPIDPPGGRSGVRWHSLEDLYR